MSIEERTGTRDLTLSAFHRLVLPSWCKAIDIDFNEVCHKCGEPIALIEATEGKGDKSTEFVVALGRRAGLAVYLVRWHRDPINAGIGDVWVTRVFPKPRELVVEGTALNLRDWFVSLRDDHVCEGKASA